MNNNSDPMFEQYAEMDFADAAPVAKVADLAKLQAAHSGKSRIQVIRGLRVIIDVDLAVPYGVPTKRLNEQVKRNRERFPADFLFQLTSHDIHLREAAATPVDVAQRLAELEMKTESLELSHDTFSRNTRLQLRQLLEAVRPSRATPQAHRLHHAG